MRKSKYLDEIVAEGENEEDFKFALTAAVVKKFFTS